MNLYSGNGNGQSAPLSGGSRPPVTPTTVQAQGDRNWRKNYQPAGEAFDQSVVLRQPHSWSRAIIWTLMGVTTAVIAWACIAKTDEAVPAQGKLEPEAKVAEVQVPVNGVVKEVLIKDGDRVQKDEILLKLDPTVSKAQETALRQVRKALVEENEYYQAQLNNDPSQPVPASLSPQQALLTQNRAALIAENQVYRLQLSGAASSGNLTPEEQARLRSGTTEIASRINAAELEVTQLQRQLAQVQTQIAGAKQLLEVDQGILRNLTKLYQEGGIAQLQYLQQQQQ
ncbi:MAG: HlyD family secretion protein, partial [Cyanobacteria bacterium]|nr:HlyD family secretion protein [Cyanobacteriota bacterium]MDW8201356.1 biotin/lipoyl-binding protein [Cyanobacteriota bacterium SKYGB_h_bin112]